MSAADWAVTVIAASGPSLTAEQCAIVTTAQAAGKCRVIAINSTWRMLPNADAMYAADGKFWKLYIGHIRAGFRGELWTQDHAASKQYDLRYIHSIQGENLPREADRICQGSNSGHQAIGLAYRLGACKIILCGYDMSRSNGRSHWHGDHPMPLSNGNPHAWIPKFAPLARDLKAAGCSVINASLATALECFPRGDLATVLA